MHHRWKAASADQRTIAAAMLRDYRQHHDVSQADLAVTLDCQRTDLSRVENASKRAPGWLVLEVIERCVIPTTPGHVPREKIALVVDNAPK